MSKKIYRIRTELGRRLLWGNDTTWTGAATVGQSKAILTSFPSQRLEWYQNVVGKRVDYRRVIAGYLAEWLVVPRPVIASDSGAE